MISIAIIDDDSVFCEHLQNMIKKINNRFCVSCFGNIEDFTDTAVDYNIAIIDIMLEKSNGIEKAADFPRRFNNLEIIFISIEREFFKDVYSVSHTYFLTKPVDEKELKKALGICLRRLNERSLYIKHKSGAIRIELNRIAYFEGMLKKTLARYDDGAVIELNVPLKAVEAELENSSFIRTHQSFIVNLEKIDRAYKSSLIIQDTEIPISRKHTAKVSEAVSLYLGSQL